MIKVPNNRVILSLSARHMKRTWVRNIFSIIAVILTTLLIMIVLIIGNIFINAGKSTKMNSIGQKAEVSFQYLVDDEVNAIASNSLVEKYGISRIVAGVREAPWNENPLEIRTTDEVYADMMYSTPTTGRLPKDKNEVAVKSWMLDDLGISCEIGQKFPLKFNVGSSHYEMDLTVCGIWDDSKTLFPFAVAFISDALASDLLQSVDTEENILNRSYIGSYQMNVDLCGNGSDLEKNLDKLVAETGIDAERSQPRINSVFRNSKADAGMITAVICILIVVMTSGFFLIYNIFYISIIKNIKLYGMLKTIGTTSHQIRRMVNIQAAIYCAIGIPCGLFLGYWVAEIFFPKIAAFSSVGDNISVEFSVISMIVAILLSCITVFISCHHPAKQASRTTPVEALRYNGINEISHPKKSSGHDCTGIVHMGLSNLFRNRKKTIITIVSVSLGMILVSIFYTFSNSFNVDGMVNSYIYADFLVADKSYLNFAVPYTAPANTLTESCINEISSLYGIKDTAAIYFRCDDMVSVSSKPQIKYSMLYGVDEYWYDIIEDSMIKGKFDRKKFNSGKYIIITTDDGAGIGVGDTIITNGGKNYEVMGKTSYEKLFSLSARYNAINSFSGLLPKREVTAMADTEIMSLSVFAEKGDIDRVENNLRTYLTSLNSNIDYVSRTSYKDDIVKNNSQFAAVGLCISLMILFIGIINFINSSITGILSRKYEFSVLNAIGMTSKQIKLMLVSESLIFTLGTAVIFIPLGSLFSYIIIGVMLKETESFTFNFDITPMLCILLIFVIISILLPLSIYKMISKNSVIERIYDVE